MQTRLDYYQKKKQKEKTSEKRTFGARGAIQKKVLLNLRGKWGEPACLNRISGSVRRTRPLENRRDRSAPGNV